MIVPFCSVIAPGASNCTMPAESMPAVPIWPMARSPLAAMLSVDVLPAATRPSTVRLRLSSSSKSPDVVKLPSVAMELVALSSLAELALV